MRKLLIAVSITGWLAAGLFWYGGYKVTQERDSMTTLAESMQLRMSLCMEEKAKAQESLQMGCFKGEAL